MSNANMNPSDLFIYGSLGDKYAEIKQILAGNNRLSEVDFQLLVALFGLNKNVPHVPDTEKNYATISRVSYQRYSMEFDVRFGLITILSHLNSDYSNMINNVAFQKNNAGEKYSELTNVSTFYDAIRSGIDPLFNLLNVYDIESDADIFSAISEYLDEEYAKIKNDL